VFHERLDERRPEVSSGTMLGYPLGFGRGSRSPPSPCSPSRPCTRRYL